MKQDESPPSKKYFNPALVEPSLSLCNVAKIYTAKDCNSILKYIEIKSALEISKDAPNTLNKIIKGYSDRTGPPAICPYGKLLLALAGFINQGIIINEATTKINVSIP
jgi:hypothetical protein